jgi:hypothetical protein
MRKTRLLLVCIGLFNLTLSAFGLELLFDFQEIEVFYDVLRLENSDSDSAPSPILGVLGAGARFKLTDLLSFRPGIGFYGIEYFYRDGKAFPAEIEKKDAVGTLGLLIELPVVYRYDFKDTRFSAGGGLGPALSVKIPLIPHGDAPTGEVAGYFLEDLRFFYLEIRGFFDWNLSDLFGLSFRLRALLPVFHLWDGENVPFSDQMMLGAGVGLRIKL